MTGSEPGVGRRWAALLLFVATPLVLLLLGLGNVFLAFDARLRAEEFAVQANRLSSRATAGATLSPASVVDPAEIVVLAGSRSLAEAELQRRVVGLVSASSGQIAESGALELATDAASSALALRVTLDIDNPGLLRFLHAVEAGTPFMTITDLAIRSAQAMPGAGDGLLRVEATIRAEWRTLAS